MKIQLPESIVSMQDLSVVVGELRTYSSWLGRTAIKQRVSKEASEEPPVLAPAASYFIKHWAKDEPLSRESLDELIAALEDFAAEAPSITFTLAALPPGSLKKLLVSWCRQNLNANILVNFKFNSNLLGGLVVNYGSHIYDWSFRRQILAASNRLPEVLRRV